MMGVDAVLAQFGGGAVLRALTVGDAARCAELERMLFEGDDPWSEQAFLYEFGNPSTVYVGVEDADGVLVGYAGLARLGPVDDPEFEVHTIGVDPGCQRRGFGRAMMDCLVGVADQAGGPVFLEVRMDNGPAIAMYESYGFERMGVRRNYYQPSGADAYTMVRPAAV